jgi:hypothetical protein
MKKITADEFYEMIWKNPNVFENWNTPLEITEFIECKNSKITHLSEHLIFSGSNEDENVANFWECKNLKIATGTFHGYVCFNESGIEKIEKLTILQTNQVTKAVSFRCCRQLQTATGTYPGSANFFGTGIHTIQNLKILKPDYGGEYANFYNCHNLQTLEGWDLSQRIWIEGKKLLKEKKRRASLQKYLQESQPKKLPFL